MDTLTFTPKHGLLKRHGVAVAYLSMVIDLFAILAAGILTYWYKFSYLDMAPNYRVALVLCLVIAAFTFNKSGLYDSWRGQDLFEQGRTAGVGWGLALLILVVIAFLTKTSAMYSREWLIIWGISGYISLIAFRVLRYGVFRYARKNEVNVRRVAIIGASQFAKQIAEKIKESDWTGLKVACVMDTNGSSDHSEASGISAAGNVANLSASIENLGIDEVWIALPLYQEKVLKNIIYRLRHDTVTIRYVPQLSDLPLLNQSITEFAGIPVLNLSETPMRGINLFLKNAEDSLLASIILVLISPLMLAIAVGIKLGSHGPVFFSQERMGWNGKSFQMLKFRSMPANAEAATGPIWATKENQRATPFGAFLRKTSLDELPQFINVLKGDMSVVGPRPERPVFVEKFKDEIPGYMKKHMVKAGITGWAQINGWRGNTDLHKRIEYDLYYIENWSLWFDLRIIFLSLFRGFTHSNAY